MILYSIIPPEVVFKGLFETQEQYYIAEFRGEKVMVIKRPDNHYEITRLLSTCPSKFLDPEYQPGIPVNEKDLKKIRS